MNKFDREYTAPVLDEDPVPSSDALATPEEDHCWPVSPPPGHSPSAAAS